MRVLFIAASDERLASARLRVHQYIKPLESEGFACTVARAREIGLRNLRQLRDYDVTFLQKRIFSIPWILAASVFARKLIFDFDDAIWTNPNMDWSALKKMRLGLRLRSILSRASCVTVGNTYLADYAGRYNRNVKIIPTCIDTAYYRPGPQRDGKTVRIGWVGSRPNLIYLEHLEPVFKRLAVNSDISLVVICDQEYRSPNVPTEFTPWSLEGELDALQSFDIGVMPLVDNEWTRGKCGFKTIQYMACGIPSVSSRAGFSRDLVVDGVNGFLSGDEDEWVEKLMLLARNDSLRRTMGLEGRRTAEERYSIEVGGAALMRIIRSVGSV